MSITIDTTSFEKALRNTLLHTSRDMSEVLNGTAINVITTAAKLTQKANKGDIVYELFKTVAPSSKPTLRPSVARKYGKIFGKPSLVGHKGKLVPLLYLLINHNRKTGAGGVGTGPALNNMQMSATGKKFLARRMASIGYTAFAGWQKALMSFPGARGFGSKAQQKGFSVSGAARGSGKRATVGNLMAMFSNTAEWVEHIGAEPLQEALDLREAEMISHMSLKLDQRCKEASS
jgi:hypothetical protein